jgi:hypothetical protein
LLDTGTGIIGYQNRYFPLRIFRKIAKATTGTVQETNF